jgi:hypothetical protein
MASKEEKIAELWMRRQAASQQLRSVYEERWQSNWEWYRCQKETDRIKGQYWNSNKILPDAFRVVETAIPQHVLGMFRTPNWFSVEAPSAAGETYQGTVKSLLLRGWRGFDGFTKAIEGIKYGNIVGHFTGMLFWDVKIGEKEVRVLDFDVTPEGEQITSGIVRQIIPTVLHNGPQLEILDNYMVWRDPSGQEKWLIRNMEKSLAELRETSERFKETTGVPLYKNLDNVEAKQAFGRALSRSTRDVPAGGFGSFETDDLASIVDGIPRSFRQDNDAVILKEGWGWVPRMKANLDDPQEPTLEYQDTQMRLQTMIGDTVIRDVPMPSMVWPFFQVPAIPVPHDIYGDSPLSYIGDLIDLKSFVENARRDEVLLNMYGTYAIDRDAEITHQAMMKMPGGAVRIRPDAGKTVGDSIVPLPRQPVLPDSWLYTQQKDEQIKRTSGSTEPFEGSFAPGGSHRTATEFQGTLSVGQGRFALATMWLDEKFKRVTLEKMFKLYQTRMDQEEVLESADDPGVRGPISMADLVWDVDIHVDSGLFGSMDQQQLQALIQIGQLAGISPEAAATIDIGELVRLAVHRMGITSARRLVRSRDDVARILQEQQQQQLLIAALEASDEPAGAGQAGGRNAGA